MDTLNKDHHQLHLNSKFLFVFHPQYSVMIVYEALMLTVMIGAERERFCGCAIKLLLNHMVFILY